MATTTPPQTWTTAGAVRLLQTTLPTLTGALRCGKFPAPAKDAHGFYVWTEADLERARQALAVDRRRKEVRDAS